MKTKDGVREMVGPTNKWQAMNDSTKIIIIIKTTKEGAKQKQAVKPK